MAAVPRGWKDVPYPFLIYITPSEHRRTACHRILSLLIGYQRNLRHNHVHNLADGGWLVDLDCDLEVYHGLEKPVLEGWYRTSIRISSPQFHGKRAIALALYSGCLLCMQGVKVRWLRAKRAFIDVVLQATTNNHE